jgi:hypothetical protein
LEGALRTVFCERGIWGLKFSPNEPYLLEVLARRGVVIDAWALAAAKPPTVSGETIAERIAHREEVKIP